MASTDQTAPTLLSLPTEIRQAILRYAFIGTCAPTSRAAWARKYQNSHDTHIQLYIPPRIPKIRRDPFILRADSHGTWGTRAMGNLFCINHQLMLDAIELVYAGTFTFQLGPDYHWPEGTMDGWLLTIGEKKRLVQKIGFEIGVGMNYLLLGAVDAYEQRQRIQICLKWSREFKNLKRVEIRLWHIQNCEVRGADKEREILSEMVLELISIFRGVEVVVDDETLVRNGIVGVKEACAGRREVAAD